MKNVFIRGSVVRYVHLPASSVDTQLLEDATRRSKFLFFSFFYFLMLARVGALKATSLTRPCSS